MLCCCAPCCVQDEQVIVVVDQDDPVPPHTIPRFDERLEEEALGEWAAQFYRNVKTF